MFLIITNDIFWLGSRLGFLRICFRYCRSVFYPRVIVNYYFRVEPPRRLAIKTDKPPSAPASKLAPNVMFGYFGYFHYGREEVWSASAYTITQTCVPMASSVMARRESNTGGIILVHAQWIQNQTPQVIFNGGRITVSYWLAATASSHAPPVE